MPLAAAQVAAALAISLTDPLMPEMDKDTAKVSVILFDTMIHLADLRLIQEPQYAFFELTASLAGNDLDEIDLFVDRFLYDPLEFGFDLIAAVKDVV